MPDVGSKHVKFLERSLKCHIYIKILKKKNRSKIDPNGQWLVAICYTWGRCQKMHGPVRKTLTFKPILIPPYTNQLESNISIFWKHMLFLVNYSSEYAFYWSVMMLAKTCRFGPKYIIINLFSWFYMQDWMWKCLVECVCLWSSKSFWVSPILCSSSFWIIELIDQYTRGDDV